MIAVDTNVLVYAHREDSPFHRAALTRVRELAESKAAWAIPWPCVHEFLAIVTHPKIYAPPTPTNQALDQVGAWMESPSLVLLGETAGHWQALRGMVARARISGARMHDARVAAICAEHGVRALWTADRDFGRFPAVSAVNPLVTVGGEESP